MSKPDWCPQRVWDEADQVSIRPDVAQIEAIARAILAAEQREREACAVIVEADSANFDFQKAWEEMDDIFTGYMSARRDLAAAIRNRGTENE